MFKKQKGSPDILKTKNYNNNPLQKHQARPTNILRDEILFFGLPGLTPCELNLGEVRLFSH